MRNDFEMVTHEFNQPIVIVPISDVHYAMQKMLLPAHVADPQKIKLYMSEHRKKIEVVW